MKLPWQGTCWDDFRPDSLELKKQGPGRVAICHQKGRCEQPSIDACQMSMQDQAVSCIPCSRHARPDIRV